jgi:hypothetical protein
MARELVTSANPPTLARGKASEAINRIFIIEIGLGECFLRLRRNYHWE